MLMNGKSCLIPILKGVQDVTCTMHLDNIQLNVNLLFQSHEEIDSWSLSCLMYLNVRKYGQRYSKWFKNKIHKHKYKQSPIFDISNLIVN